MAAGILMIAIGLTVALTAMGVTRFVPGLPVQPGDRVPLRQRLALDPAKRNRAQSVTLLAGGVLFVSGVATLVVSLIERGNR